MALVVSTEEIPQSVVMMTPGAIREESVLGSKPALSSRLVAVDGTGLLRFVVVVFSRGAHHIAPLHITPLLAELLAHLGGDLNPGLSPGPAGPEGDELERCEEKPDVTWYHR